MRSLLALARYTIALYLLCAPLSSYAATLLTYTGPEFTLVHDETPPEGAYTIAMRITGTLTVAQDLLPNRFYSNFFGTPDPFDDRESLVSPALSFFDGRFTYGSDDADTIVFVEFKTTAGLTIDSWNVVLTKSNPTADASIGQIFVHLCGNFDLYSCDQAYLGPPGGLDPRDGAAVTFNGLFTKGSWTVSAVPEPATYGLMLIGLGFVGFAARLRTG